jgi:enoyl-CoA hydratase/carnithine racemase
MVATLALSAAAQVPMPTPTGAVNDVAGVLTTDETRALVALVGPARAKRIAGLCEKVSAETALSWGLVDHVTAPGSALAKAREVAEAALAHLAGDATEQAYARSDLFEKRRSMMEAWAQYLQPAAGNVIAFPAG